MDIHFSTTSRHSDHFGHLNRVQRERNIRWHQKHPKKPITFEPQKSLLNVSRRYTFEQVTPFHVEYDDTPPFAPQSGGINFVKAIFLVLAMSSALPIAVSSPQNSTEHEQSLVRVKRGIRPIFFRPPIIFPRPIRFPSIPIRVPKPPSKSIPKPPSKAFLNLKVLQIQVAPELKIAIDLVILTSKWINKKKVGATGSNMRGQNGSNHSGC